MFLEDVKLHTKSEPLEIDYYWRILASHFILGTSGNVHFQNYGGELRMSFEASWRGYTFHIENGRSHDENINIRKYHPRISTSTRKRTLYRDIQLSGAYVYRLSTWMKFSAESQVLYSI